MDPLDAMQQDATPKHKPLLRAVTTYIAVAAAIMITLFLTFEFGSHQTLTEKIAHEVAENHTNLKPMAVSTSSIDNIQTHLTQLDFMPIQSRYFGQFNNVMLCGGYSSIIGSTAAQLRYTNQTGRIITLYQTPYDASTFSQLPKLDSGDEPLIVHIKGVKVTIWVEKELLMVSAQE